MRRWFLWGKHNPTAEADSETRDDNRATPLRLAVMMGKGMMARILIAAGATE
ncbi:MAG: hypothetical protein GDA52_00730 [Rhodobacteraceae bacterium]|nr:hypothetical protein [Paracoccaceae bacterium]